MSTCSVYSVFRALHRRQFHDWAVPTSGLVLQVRVLAYHGRVQGKESLRTDGDANATSDALVVLQESRLSFFHFLTNICAILGGVFTVFSMFDGVVYTSQQAILGKQD